MLNWMALQGSLTCHTMAGPQTLLTLVSQAMPFSDGLLEPAYRQHTLLKWLLWDLLLAALSAVVLFQQKHEVLENVVLGCQTSSFRWFQRNMLQCWMGLRGQQNDLPGTSLSASTPCEGCPTAPAYPCDAPKLAKVAYIADQYHLVSQAMQSNTDAQHLQALEHTWILILPLLNLLWTVIACSTTLIRYHTLTRSSQSAHMRSQLATTTSGIGDSSTSTHQGSTPATPGPAMTHIQLPILPAWMVTASLLVKAFWMPAFMSCLLLNYALHPLPPHLARHCAMYYISSAAQGNFAPFIAFYHIASMVSCAHVAVAGDGLCIAVMSA